MNWKSKWEDTEYSSCWSGPSNKEVQKIVDDATMFGVGYSIDEKHIPIEDVIITKAPMEIIGDLALDFTDEGWNIYHVPTGACFDMAVPPIHCEYCGEGKSTGLPNNACENCMNTGVRKPNEYEYTKEQLLTWMTKVQQSNPTAWTMLRLLKPDNYAKNGTSAKKIIQEWCLSVAVI